MSVPSCFESIIGFSRKEYDCMDHGANDPWTSDFAESLSGLYIDELPGMPQNFILALGGNYDIWEKMTNSLENAIGTFKIDVLGEILKYMEPARHKFRGDIGNKTFTNTVGDCGTYKGLRMYSDIVGGSYILRGFWLLLNVTESVTLEIYDEHDLLYSYVLTSHAGKAQYNPITPLELPLVGNYYFLYQTTGLYYNNKLGCNCGGHKWCFDICHPCYHPSREGFTEWSMVAGVCGDDITERDDWGTTRDARGLILHGDFACDVLGTLCSDHSDWTGNELDFAIANAIWYKTGEYLATYIMDTQEVNRQILLGTEQWNANRAFYNARYVAMINFIAENFEGDRNDCLKCKSPQGYAKRVQML